MRHESQIKLQSFERAKKIERKELTYIQNFNFFIKT